MLSFPLVTDAATTFDHLIRAVARVDAQPGLAPGQVLDGTYELIERIGGGGMGVVFRARDLRLGREVAVKALRPTVEAGDDAVRLFEREARATAQLLHPNIVTLHHVGVHRDLPFLVLELLSGETLAARLARRRTLALGDALEIVDQVLAAVAFAHERGVLHRDLKPNNVFITADERIKVLDFGIALSIDAATGPITRAAGTPGYMAPEQREGSAQDARTDVWAAALLLVECLNGKRLGEAPAKPDASDEASTSAPRGALAANASLPALDELEISPELRAVLARALDADPANRPSNGGELRRLLAGATAPLKVSGTPATAPRPRRVVPLIAACAVAAAAGAGIAYAVMVTHRAPPITAAELGTQSWHVAAFGDLLLRIEPSGEAYGVYEHDDGIVSGRFEGGEFIGWWCELPTRRAPDDGGRLQIHFLRDGERIVLDGSWTYGGDPGAPWQRDFLGISTEIAAISPLEKRLQHREACPR